MYLYLIYEGNTCCVGKNCSPCLRESRLHGIGSPQNVYWRSRLNFGAEKHEQKVCASRKVFSMKCKKLLRLQDPFLVKQHFHNGWWCLRRYEQYFTLAYAYVARHSLTYPAHCDTQVGGHTKYLQGQPVHAKYHDMMETTATSQQNLEMCKSNQL